tara:strand:+ start:916 stop:1299 length:384 start_codon:yes stop_codon:yes gene_type:complete
MPEYTYECEACEVYFSKVFNREEYDKKGSKVRCPECNKAKKVCRSYVDDNIQTNVAFTLSECKTLGHYAEKQTAKYGKYEVEDMRAGFKTKKSEPMKELPEGMSRMEKPKDSTSWTREPKKRRKVNR